jgi:hypothetical protein
MSKTSIGTLELSPLKENGKFVFLNNSITINGKVSKGDYVKIFVEAYSLVNGKYQISTGRPEATLLVKGVAYHHNDPEFHKTIDEYYQHITEVYKNHFYFSGKKK